AQSVIAQVFSVAAEPPPINDPPSAAVSATLLMRNGTSISDGWLPGSARQIRLLINGQVATFSPRDVDQLIFASTASPVQGTSDAPPPQVAEGQSTDQVIAILGQ